MKARYIPSDYQKKIKNNVNAEIFYNEENGKYNAIGYSGKKSKHDFHYSFKTEEQFNKYIENYLKGLTAREELKAARKKETLAFVHLLQVGDILVSSWGWEQTNVDFYQVIEVKGKMVKIQEIAQSMPNGEEGFMTGYVIPLKDKFLEKEEPMLKKVLKGNMVKIASYAWASLWDGQRCRTSWYG
jgi:hypothetical protein